MCYCPSGPSCSKDECYARSTPAIHWINLYPLNSAIGFCDDYPLDSDTYTNYIYIEWCYPAIEQLWPVCY